MQDQFATTKHNIALLSHLFQAVKHIVDGDPNILTITFYRDYGGKVHLTEHASTPDFLSSLQVPFVIQARDSGYYPWQALAYHEGLAVFRLLTDYELHHNFHMHPSSFDTGDDDDPGEHFIAGHKPGTCPQCRQELQCGDGVETPALYCDNCGMGWDSPDEVESEYLADDPGEHFMDDDGRPKGYELEQHQAEMEQGPQGEDIPWGLYNTIEEGG